MGNIQIYVSTSEMLPFHNENEKYWNQVLEMYEKLTGSSSFPKDWVLISFEWKDIPSGRDGKGFKPFHLTIALSLGILVF